MTDHLETWQHIDDLRFENQQLRSEVERLRKACEAARPILELMSSTSARNAVRLIQQALNPKGASDEVEP